MDLPPPLRPKAGTGEDVQRERTLKEAREAFERAYIAAELQAHEGNVSRIAKSLKHVATNARLANPAEWPLLEAEVLEGVLSGTRPGGMIGSRLRNIWHSDLRGPAVASNQGWGRQ